MFGEAIKRAQALESAVARLRNEYGEEGYRRAREIWTRQPIGAQDTVDAFHDCFCAGFDLTKAEATVMESLRTSVPVRMLIELWVRMVAAQASMPILPALMRDWDDEPTPERPLQVGPRIGDVARVDMSTKRQVDKKL